jgi:universal stress protein A
MKHLLVPCDLLDASYAAVRMAGQLALKANARITLLHVAANAEQAKSARESLRALKQKLTSEVACEADTQIVEGNFLSEIGRVAQETQADLAVMITHGMVGAQQLTGSLALQVITEAGIPFLVVQSSTSVTEFGIKALLALENKNASKEEMDKLISFLKVFEAEVELFLHSRDELHRLEQWEQFFTEQLTDAQLRFSVTHNRKYDFSKAAVAHALNTQCKLIVALNYSYENLYSISPRTDEEDLIYNTSGIPVLLVTPENQDDDLERPEDI